MPRINAEDFAEFAEMLTADEDFPRTHAVGHLAEAPRAELAHYGCIAKSIDVRRAGFRLAACCIKTSFCASGNIVQRSAHFFRQLLERERLH